MTEIQVSGPVAAVLCVALALVVVRTVELGLLFAGAPTAFAWGWVGAEIRWPSAIALPAPYGSRGTTSRAAYKVLDESHVVFVSHDLIDRNQAIPLKGTITLRHGECHAVGRTSLWFVLGNAGVIAGMAWWTWPSEPSFGAGARLFAALWSIGIASFVAWCAHQQLDAARREFALDLAEVNAALGIRGEKELGAA